MRKGKTFTPEPANAPTGPERLQKVLAAAGLGSRRSCEELILKGRVAVNNTIIRELGTKVGLDDKIEIDGQKIEREKLVYLVVNKPRGYVCTSADPSGRPMVVELVSNVPQRVYTVGRLDEDSTGLLILTNDGELANKLAHPKFGVEKVYKAVVAGHPSPDVITKLMEGVWLSDGKARARRVRVVGHAGDSTQVEMVLAEGKNREVRRMWAKFGHKVMRLNRVAIGPLHIKGLKVGEWRNLTVDELNDLRRLAAGKKVDTAWFDDREPLRRETKPRRGAAKHEFEAAARKTRSEIDAEAVNHPPAVRGPRASAGGPAANANRPLGPRSEGPGGGPSPRGPRSEGQGAGPRGPRSEGQGAGPRGPRSEGQGAGPRGPRMGGGPGGRNRLQGPGEHRYGIPQDAGLTGRPRKNARPRDDDDDGDEDVEISLPSNYGADVPGAHAALPPSKRPKGPASGEGSGGGSEGARPRGPGGGGGDGGRPRGPGGGGGDGGRPRGPGGGGGDGGRPRGPGGPKRAPQLERLPVKRSRDRNNKDPELGVRRVIGLDSDAGPSGGGGGGGTPSRAGEARRDRPDAKRVRPISKPRRKGPGSGDDE